LDSFVDEALSSYSTGADPLLNTAMALHDAALKDDYFVSRKLAPNVDFWRYDHTFATERSSDHFVWFDSGLIYRAMGAFLDKDLQYESELMNTRFPDGLFPRPIRRTPCCGVACALASGTCIIAAVMALLMLETR